MFYSDSKNRHKRWYHKLSVGHRYLWIIGIFCALLLVAALTFLAVYSLRAAAYDITLVNKTLRGSVLFDENYRTVATLSDHENTPVQWEELPEHLVNAFIAREDSHFFDHGGVVYSAFVRSLLRNVSSMKYKQGGSTITMQLTRNVYELQGKTLDRKLLEIALTHRVESNYDKHTILCQYLSRIYFGQGCYGIREAARYYFGKMINELTLEESALLAGIVRAPSLYNPKRSLSAAQKVRRETLQRMLELEMITEERYLKADATPIAMAQRIGPRTPDSENSYPALWANAELERLTDVQDEQGQGMSVVSHINLNLQQYTENAVLQTLETIENPELFPDAWKEGEGADALMKFFASARRPAWLKPPGEAQDDGQATLQCCALIIDSRMNHRGNVLAVVSGRDASDRVDRWQGEVQPGRAIAPLVFCCACLPGGNAHHIVAHSAEVTGSRLGYPMVRAFFDSLALDTELPDQAHENDLFNGRFLIRRIDLARLLFDLQNMGKGYKLNIISSLWSRGQRLIYSTEAEKAPEYIRRESAVAVSHLAPFRYREGEPLVLHEELPNQGGQWTMVFNDKGVAVFVWIGIEPAGEQVPKLTADLSKLISQAALQLAKDLHTVARRELRAAAQAPKS